MTDPDPALREPGVHAPLAPVFLGLRIALHTLVAGLVVFVIVRAVALSLPNAAWIVTLSVILLVSYVCGALVTRNGAAKTVLLWWLALLTAEGLALVTLTPDAAFLVFPLFFLQLHLLRAPWAVLVVTISTLVTVVALALHTGWSVGGVLGPVIGAAVAVVIGLGYRALYREAEQRQRLIEDLVDAREELATREREAGVLEERARLAREIHDTVAQGLSSIQLLLHAAERDLTEPSLGHVRLARKTAASNLAEARRFIRELAPPALQEQSLPGALSRLVETASVEPLAVSFHLSGTATELPMRFETALLRIAQASLANAAQHANATRAEVTLTYLDDWVGLDIVDDGAGFDPRAIADGTSFGLIGLRGRVDQLGGTLSIESSPGAGTAVAASFSLDGAG